MTRQPNLLFLMPDQLRHDYVGCYGADFVSTPAIDGLAAQGTRYETAISPVPVCVPARASMISGQSSVASGVIDNLAWLRPDRRELGVETWPELLARAGYRTAAIGKMHFYPWDISEGFEDRIIAEDKAIDEDRPQSRRRLSAKPALQAVPDVTSTEDAEEILELTDELPEQDNASAQGVFGDRRKEERLIDDNKLDSMRQSLSALVEKEAIERRAPQQRTGGTSLEDMTRELMRPMIKQWLDQNLPELVEELVAREIQRLSEK